MDIENTDNSTAPDQNQRQRKHSIARQFFRFVKRIFFFGAAVILGYLAIAVIGLYPVNADFVETEDGIEIFVFSGEFHSDLILPMKNEIVDWSSHFEKSGFQSAPGWATHVSLGWGDRDFYLHTPSWKDLKISTAVNALVLPSETVMHVSHEARPTENFSVRGVKISTEQYKRLVKFVSNSFAVDDKGDFQKIPDAGYHQYDAFYKGAGKYHGFKTCNCWVGQAIKSAGIKTGWFTPLPKTPLFYISN